MQCHINIGILQSVFLHLLFIFNNWSSVGSPKASPKGSSKALLVDENRVDQEKKQLVFCFGEMLIDFVPTVNGVSLAEAPAFKKAPGGAPANVAVGIARLGGFAAFIGKVHF